MTDDWARRVSQQLAKVASRNNFAVPSTPAEAETFLRAIMGLKLWEETYGELKGTIVGYSTLDGANYGGHDGLPLPPGARAAFMMAKEDWVEVKAPKKRARTGVS